MANQSLLLFLLSPVTQEKRVPTIGQVMEETYNQQMNISMSRVISAMKKNKAEQGERM